MTNDETLLLDLIEHPVFVLEPDGQGFPRYTAVNSLACKAFERPRVQVLGKTAAEVFEGQIGQTALERHLAALESGQDAVHTIILPLGSGARIVRTVLRPMRAEDGAVTRIVGTSAGPGKKSCLRERRSDVPRRSQDLEHFVTLAAHDLRAPMRHVATLAQMMREEFRDLTTEQRELLDLLDGVSEKTLALIGDVLLHAQTGTAAQAASRFELGALVDDIRIMIDPFRSCTLHRPHGWLSADRTAVQIVLRNLIDNALKHGVVEGAQEPLVLSVSIAPTDAAHVALRVHDTGPGFDPKALADLAEGGFTPAGGYGLMAVRRLVEARNGDLQLANHPGGGAEITVTLPGQWSPDHAPHQTGSGPPRHCAVQPGRGRRAPGASGCGDRVARRAGR